jgi:hypothetical protein
VRWFHRVKNEDVFERAAISAHTDMIVWKRSRWSGHVSRRLKIGFQIIFSIGNPNMEKGQEVGLERA